MDKTLWFCDVLIRATPFPICYLSQLKHLGMNEVVLGKHVRRTSFTRPKPSSLWEWSWTNVTNHNHYVILIFFFRFIHTLPRHTRNFRLLFYSSIFVVFPIILNKPNEDWYWMASRNIVYLSLFHVVWSVFVVVFFTLTLFLCFSTDHDLVWSNVELHWRFRVFGAVFQAVVYIIHNILKTVVYSG